MHKILIADKLEQRPYLPTLLGFSMLTAALAAQLAWFAGVNPYDNHYFDAGSLAVVHHLLRMISTLLFAWLIYAPGAGIVALAVPRLERNVLSATDRALLGFALGANIWYIVLLPLGFAGLYDRWVMAGLAFAVIALSSRHAGQLAWSAIHSESRWSPSSPQQWVAAGLVTLAGMWLFVVKGLYPGGGGDYYTHYFPYALQVLQNHGLAPNDVWYHFYYSKGDGLFFLDMLLTDPMAPSLVTCLFVGAAALAIFDLGKRLGLGGSLWPVCGVLAYLLYNAVSMNRAGGGEFQKSHELVGALMALTAWALYRHRSSGKDIFLTMAAACASSTAIVNLPVGAVLSVFFGILAAEAVLLRNWRLTAKFCLAGLFAGLTAIAILAINQFMTGLASDQGLNFTLNFADFPRLDREGLLPQIVSLVWLHDNLDNLTAPFDIVDFFLLFDFMRLNLLWPILAAPAIILAVYLVGVWRTEPDFLSWGRARLKDVAATSFRKSLTGIAGTVLLFGLFIGLFAAVVLVGGRAQSVSTGRLSTFFVPLLILLNMALVAWTLKLPLQPITRQRFSIALPFAALLLTMITWQVDYKWGQQVADGAVNGIRLLSGVDSLGSAYSRKPLGPLAAGLPYGGIEPGTLAAARQLPPNTPIWSTNVDSYCMVPGCNIESVVSFKMSGQMDEILGGSPDRARELLKQAGLNYFLVSKEHRLLDMLPYSRLFDPEVLGQYLGVAWTDGTTYLLTWIGPATTPIDNDFLDTYKSRLAEPESPWFYFRDLIIHLQPGVAELRTAQPNLSKALVWRMSPTSGIEVVSATYGENCRFFRPPSPFVNTFRRDNAAGLLRKLCNGQMQCAMRVDVNVLPDPAPGCRKKFTASYRCAGEFFAKHVELRAEANGQTFAMECPARQEP